MNLRAIHLAAPSLAVALTLLVGCSSKVPSPTAAPDVVHNVAVLTVQTSGVADLLRAEGTIRATQTAEVASQMMGNLVSVQVQEGDRVRRGQLLALVDDAQPHAATERAQAAQAAAGQEVAAAESDLALAEATLKRYQILYDRKSVSAQEFDEMKARQQSALAHRDMAQAGQTQARTAVTQARTSLGYSQIRAPFDGVITARKADPGTFVSPGTPVFTVESVQRYRLEVAVNESDLRLVRAGQTVPITVDALDGLPLTGKVAQIVPAADPASRSFLVKLELPSDARLRSGLFGRAAFARGERQALLIPRAAVVERGQLQCVYTVDGNLLTSLRYVTLGEPSGTQVEVLSGLQSGERIVAAPGALDLSGKRIEAGQ